MAFSSDDVANGPVTLATFCSSQCCEVEQDSCLRFPEAHLILRKKRENRVRVGRVGPEYRCKGGVQRLRFNPPVTWHHPPEKRSSKRKKWKQVLEDLVHWISKAAFCLHLSSPLFCSCPDREGKGIAFLLYG